MTLEEYEVRLQAEMAVSYKAIENIGKFDEGTAKYYKGQTDAFNIALDLLKKLDHDVTLRAVVEECKDCYGCSFCLIGENEDGSLFQAGCLCDGCPGNWDIDAIQKCMKEARDED